MLLDGGALTFKPDIHESSNWWNGIIFDYIRGIEATDGNLYRISRNKTANLLDIKEIEPLTDYINATPVTTWH